MKIFLLSSRHSTNKKRKIPTNHQSKSI
ncbi:BnaAnng08910D [Brassica napus]|uniref:BnaAnng08910D protein n=1 Tax=Brassica napus TaxID=3708 RepID=A0A078IAY6_BRANA|nr:BnaAnng08910D [Brassica napus]